MRIRKWVFLRHFEKEPHPLTERLTIEQLRAESVEALKERVRLWNEADLAHVPLTMGGRAHALSVREPLRRTFEHLGGKPVRIYVSPYRRTLQSLSLIKESFPGVPHFPDERVAEVNPGLEAFAPVEDLRRRFRKYDLALKQYNYLDVPVPFGDVKANRREAARGFLEHLKTVKGNVLVVTHVGIIDCVQQIVAGWPDDYVIGTRFQDPNRVPYGSAYVCAYDTEANNVFTIEQRLILAPLSP